MKVSTTNNKSGATSRKARRLARPCASCKAAISGRPSAGVRSAGLTWGAVASAIGIFSHIGKGKPPPQRSGKGTAAPLRKTSVQETGGGSTAPRRDQFAASQALKRSFSSSFLSTQKSDEVSSAFVMFSGAVGRFGPITVLPSLKISSSLLADLRAGP